MPCSSIFDMTVISGTPSSGRQPKKSEKQFRNKKQATIYCQFDFLILRSTKKGLEHLVRLGYQD